MAYDTPTAVLFPGQGSQQTGMRDLVADAAPELLEHCIELVGDDPFARIDESTRFAQPAIFCASVAGWRRAAIDSTDLHAVAGHSLGEFAALVAAGALDEHAALALVVERGALMANAGERDGGGTMLALLGASHEAAEQLAADHGVTVANENAPGQVVLSGSPDALSATATQARELGLRAMELGVAGAFHSPAMAPAVPAFQAALDRTDFAAPAVPVISCVNAAPMTDPRSELADGITRPVRWTATMAALATLGVRRYVDAGPGKVLAKLARRNAADAEAVSLADLEPARG
jgi:malonyl CoA-acyl carrier protein transacylase